MKEQFINPFTFVPFPQVDTASFRRAPARHHRMGVDADGVPRLMGRIDVTLTARSPLLLRDRDGGFPRRSFLDSGPATVPFIPGSTLAGVMRSLHESLAGGCLRVFHGGFLPTYRDQVRTPGNGWQLALVEETHNGRPQRLLVCEETVRVRADALATVLGGAHKVVTGCRVDVLDYKRQRFGLPAVTEAHQLAPGAGWVVLVTDAGARSEEHPYYCTVGRLPVDEGGALSWRNDNEWNAGWAPGWDDLLFRINDTEDMRQARGQRDDPAGPLHPTAGPVTTDVVFDGRLVGRRHEARREFFPGQVLWVKPATGRTGVDAFSLTAAWRHTGSGAAGERVPEELLACRSPELLCLTCRVFGSADTAGADSPEADQRAYRGHLRFSDGRPVGDVPVLRRYSLAPLGRPRPGNGQFYLDNTGHLPRPRENADPLREWGSAADDHDLRLLRGRKHYWLTGQAEQRPLFRVTEGTFDGQMAGVGDAVPAGTRFAFSVWFENLDRAELGALFAALVPSTVLEGLGPHGAGAVDAELGCAVGGGRPFGFGTCTAEVTGVELHTASSWYTAADQPGVTVDDAVAAFTAAVDGGVRATWPALAAALHLDHVEPGQVWYPPATSIPPDGPLRTADLEAGFEFFWKHSTGRALRNETYPLVSLPEVTAPDQQLPIRPEVTRTRAEGSRRTGGQRGATNNQRNTAGRSQGGRAGPGGNHNNDRGRRGQRGGR